MQNLILGTIDDSGKHPVEFMKTQLSQAVFEEASTDELGELFLNLQKSLTLTAEFAIEYFYSFGDIIIIQNDIDSFRVNFNQGTINGINTCLNLMRAYITEENKTEIGNFLEDKRIPIVMQARKVTSLIEKIEERIRIKNGDPHPGFTTSSLNTEEGSDIQKVDLLTREGVNWILYLISDADKRKYILNDNIFKE